MTKMKQKRLLKTRALVSELIPDNANGDILRSIIFDIAEDINWRKVWLMINEKSSDEYRRTT